MITSTGGYESFDATVTGDVRINPGGPGTITIGGGSLRVASGGRLEMTGFNRAQHTGQLGAIALVVEDGGTALVSHSSSVYLDLRAGGTVLLDTVIVSHYPVTSHAGTLVAIRSSFLGVDIDDPLSPSAVALVTEAGGSTVLHSSAVVKPVLDYQGGGGIPPLPGGAGTCAGTPPVSQGWTAIEVGCGSTPQPGDVDGNARVTIHWTLSGVFPPFAVTSERVSVAAGSPLVDAIPLGAPGCDPAGVDIYGTPRGIDGNGDGIGGCDIGAVERTP